MNALKQFKRLMAFFAFILIDWQSFPPQTRLDLHYILSTMNTWNEGENPPQDAVFKAFAAICTVLREGNKKLKENLENPHIKCNKDELTIICYH